MATSATRLTEAIQAAGVPIHGVGPKVAGVPLQAGNVRVDYNGASAGQIVTAEAVVAAFDWGAAAQSTWERDESRARAAATVDETGHDGAGDTAKRLRALVLVLVDELNSLRQWDEALKAAVAAAVNLADLKVRVAALPAMPDRTANQARAALKGKINTGAADS